MKISDLQIGDKLTAAWTGSMYTKITDINATHFKCNIIFLFPDETDWIDKNVLRIYPHRTDYCTGHEIRPECGYECWVPTELVMKIDN